MKRSLLKATTISALALCLGTGCLLYHSKRGVGYIQKGQYTNVVFSITLYKSPLTQLVGLELEDIDYRMPIPRTLKESELTVWMKNLSGAAVRVSPPLPLGGRAMQLQREVKAKIWSGSFEENYYHYPLVNCHVREQSKVELELEFNPPVELTNNLALTIKQSDGP